MRRLREPRNWVLVVELDDVVPRRDPRVWTVYVIEMDAIGGR